MIEQLSKILDQRSKLDVSEVNKLTPTPVFNKIQQFNGNQIQTIDFGDFGSNKALRRLVSLLKSVADLTLDTLVYSSNKEFLVNLVNERNFAIFQNLKDNIETVRLLCEMDRRFRAKMTRQTKSFLDKKKNNNDDHSLYTRKEIVNKREKIPRVYSKNKIPIYSVNSDNGEIKLDFSKAEPIDKTELGKLISINVENVIINDVMLHSSSSDINLETLYCYYGDNQFTIEDIKPTIVSDQEIKAVVKSLMTEESNNEGFVSSTNTNNANYKTFDDMAVSITDDTNSALGCSSEFTRMESDFMQLPEFETIRLK
jgi:hypothetical protein